MTAPLLTSMREHAARSGLNLFGAVDAERFDGSQPAERRLARFLPGCGAAVVLGSGGRELWSRIVERDGVPQPPSPRRHPVRDHARRCLQELEAMAAAQGLSARAAVPGAGRPLNYPQMAEAAGFGTVSPVIGTLLHPDYGPWVSVVGVLAFEGNPFGALPDASLVDRFQPCCGCPRPCLDACPVGVHDGEGNSELHVCASHRHAGNCHDGCSVRRACPVGSDHRYGPQEEHHRQMHRLFALRRMFGLGAWRLVPRFLRR